jgi:hypothetical protein
VGTNQLANAPAAVRLFFSVLVSSSALGLASGSYYAWILDSGVASSSDGVSFIIGQKFLENYYAVFDTDKSQVGFAYPK